MTDSICTTLTPHEHDGVSSTGMCWRNPASRPPASEEPSTEGWFDPATGDGYAPDQCGHFGVFDPVILADGEQGVECAACREAFRIEPAYAEARATPPALDVEKFIRAMRIRLDVDRYHLEYVTENRRLVKDAMAEYASLTGDASK